jgi:serine/threonine protein kinase
MHLLKREFEICRRTNHGNIVAFYDIVEDAKRFYISMEFCSDGTLKSVMEKERPMPEARAKEITR